MRLLMFDLVFNFTHLGVVGAILTLDRLLGHSRASRKGCTLRFDMPGRWSTSLRHMYELLKKSDK